MKPTTTNRYAVFLILLVLGQEFCVGRHPAPPNQSLLEKRFDKLEINEAKNSLQVKSRQKRVSYVVVLLAITLASSIATMSFEIWLKHSGCCKLPDDSIKRACKRADLIPKLRKSWENKTKEIDQLFLAVKNLREDIIHHSYKLEEIYIKLEGITRYYSGFIDRISPGTSKKFQIKWNEIEKELEKGNRTVADWTTEQLDMQFKSYFDYDVKTAVFGMSTFLTNAFSAVYTVSQAYYKRSYQNKMIAQLSTGKNRLRLVKAYQGKAGRSMGLTNAGIKEFIKNTAKGKTDAKFGMSSKYASLYHAYNVIGTLWSLGSDAYRIYKNVKSCQDKADKINEQYEYWEKADKEMDEAKANATKFLNELKYVHWKNVKANLSDPNLLQTLNNSQRILNSGTTSQLRSAGANIVKYIDSIKTVLESNPDQALEIERNMNSGLATLRFMAKCYDTRLRFFGYVSGECINGAGSLAHIYNKGKPLFYISNCSSVGVSEVTFADMQKANAAKAKTEKYNPDCILNDKYIQGRVCSDKNGGYTVSEIAKRRSLTEAQAQYLMNICPPPQLEAHVKERVCKLKCFGFSNAEVYDFYPQYSKASLDAVKCTC